MVLDNALSIFNTNEPIRSLKHKSGAWFKDGNKFPSDVEWKASRTNKITPGFNKVTLEVLEKMSDVVSGRVPRDRSSRENNTILFKIPALSDYTVTSRLDRVLDHTAQTYISMTLQTDEGGKKFLMRDMGLGDEARAQFLQYRHMNHNWKARIEALNAERKKAAEEAVEFMALRARFTQEVINRVQEMAIANDRTQRNRSIALEEKKSQKELESLKEVASEAFATDDCPICMDPLGKTNVITLRCGHTTCGDCIFRHFQNAGGTDCPMCRSQYAVRVPRWVPPITRRP
jgi:hypothetical protein